MGMDYERKSCRLDRRRSKRGSKKSQDSGAPREDAYLFVANDDEMFKTYSVPDFRIEFYFPEDGLWFDQTILKTIAEYIPSFGFRCFKKSREEMKGGIISHGSHSPSVFHYAGIFKREQTFVYNFPTQSWDLVICLGNHETRQTDPMLRERHFHVEPTQDK